MDEIKALFNAIIERLDVQNAHMEQMKMDIAHLQGDVKQLKEDVALLKGDVAVLKEDVAVLKADVAVLKEDVAVLKEDVAVLKRDVSSLKEGQARQDKILERLSIRSIEQEADIAELRRIK
jgi:chromosome segregation ATPase